MRVCIISDGLPYDHGGAQLRAYRHARHLQTARDIDTTLIAWNRSGQSIIDDELSDIVIPVKLRFKPSGSQSTMGRMIKLLLHLIEINVRSGLILFKLRHKVDMLHIINAASWFSLITIPLAKILNKPVIVEMVLRGGDDPLKLSERSHPHKKQLFPHRPLKYSLFLQADAYVSKSHALSEAYRQAGLSEAKLFQIYSGVDVDKYQPSSLPEKKLLRQELGLADNQTIILFVGGINERKGVDRLLAAFRQVALTCSQAHLLVVGPSAPSEMIFLQTIHRQIQDWNLSQQVTLVNKQVSNVDEYLKAADIFALPTRREGLSVAILEAMATALPIVASNIPEIALSQIQHNKEGLLVPVEDIQKLATSLTTLVNDTTLRSQLGQAARRRVLQEFTVQQSFDQYVHLYQKLLEQKPPAQLMINPDAAGPTAS